MNYNIKIGISSLLAGFIVALSGCGSTGTSTSAKDTTAGGIEENANDRVVYESGQPHKIARANWVGVDPLVNSNLGDLQVTSDATNLSFKIANGNNFAQHIQLYIDIDNDKNSGYVSTTWADSGSDYLVEDGELYKARGNGASWSWEYVSRVSFVRTHTDIEIELAKTLLNNLNTSFQVGAISRTGSWRIDKILPASAQMVQYTIGGVVNPPVDDTAPVIQLVGASDVVVNLGTVYTDLGASAQDNTDGDISAKIATNNPVNTAVLGRYEVVYTVQDNAKNSTREVRVVTVVNPTPTNPSEIVVDANDADWVSIATLGTNGASQLKVSDDDTQFFAMLSGNTGAHTQFFIDVDSDASTGFTSATLAGAGADFLVEDGDIYKSTANSSAWNWEYVGVITYAKSASVVEMAVPKALLGEESDSIKIAAISRSNGWRIISQVPDVGMVTYEAGSTLPPVVNTKPLANAQSVVVDEDSNVTVTLAGSDADGDTLTYDIMIQPTNGTLIGTAPSLSYVPNVGYFGSDSFTFVVNDGKDDSAEASVSITINETVAVNVKPLANAQTVTTQEDVNATVTLSGSDSDNNATLTYAIVSTPSNGVLTGTAPNLSYVPNAGYFGSDSFTFVVNDGIENSDEANVSIVITEASSKNTRSVPTSQNATTDEGVTVAIVLESSDADGDTLTYSITQNPLNGTLSGIAPNVSYTPNAEFTGTDTFSFVSHDGIEASEEATVTITVNAVVPIFEGAFADIKTLIQRAKDGFENNVTYISVGDSTRAIDAYYNGGELYTAVSSSLNTDNVVSSLNAIAGHTLRKWNDFDANRTINEPTWESTVEAIPADGSTAIVNISLGINDARYYGDGGEVARLKFHMGQAIDKVLLAKPNTLIMLTMPHLLVGLDTKTAAIKQAYEEMAVERGLPLIHTMNDLPTLADDLTNYRAEDAVEYGESIRIHLSSQGQTAVSALILSNILP